MPYNCSVQRAKTTDYSHNNTILHSSTMTPPSPVGIEIPFGKKKWKVGRVLGKGACAIVCSLDYQGKETDFAVKLAPLPVKTTKKGNSVEETNAKLLYYENLLYRSHFQALQGKCIPMVPQSSAQGPPSYGEVNGTDEILTNSVLYFSLVLNRRPRLYQSLIFISFIISLHNTRLSLFCNGKDGQYSFQRRSFDSQQQVNFQNGEFRSHRLRSFILCSGMSRGKEFT